MKNAIFNDFVEGLRDSVDIVNIISDYVALKKKGKNYWGCCPFHQENTPSFSVSPDKGFFYCFGCQTGGNIFSFLMKKENVGFFEAVKILAGKMNVPLPEMEKTPRDKLLEEEGKNLLKACELARDFFHVCLMKTSYGKPAREYLDKRGITLESIEQFKLGFAPPFWDKLTLALKEKGVSVDILLKAGLSIPRQSQDGVYDRFRNRIIFPICDVRGRVIGFGGRALGDSQPKYLNSPETRFFNKRHVLYSFDLAYKYIKNSGQAIIVEGYLDAIAAHSMGFKNVVASLGTAFTQEQGRQLLKCSNPELVFAYDSDAAGQKASERALNIAKNMLGAKIRVISLPDAKDPDEYLRKSGSEAFRRLINDALPLMDYQIGRILSEYKYSDIEGKINVVGKIAPVLAASDNAVEVNAYISSLAQKIGVDENAFRLEIRKEVNWHKKDKNVKTGKDKIVALASKQPVSAQDIAERQLIRLMVEQTEIIPYCAAELNLEELVCAERKEIINFVFNAYNMKGNISPDVLRSSSQNLSEKAVNEFSQIIFAENSSLKDESNGVFGGKIFPENLSRLVGDYLKTIKLAHLTRLYEYHRLTADELERAGEAGYLQELAESQRIKNEINKINKINESYKN